MREEEVARTNRHFHSSIRPCVAWQAGCIIVSLMCAEWCDVIVTVTACVFRVCVSRLFWFCVMWRVTSTSGGKDTTKIELPTRTTSIHTDRSRTGNSNVSWEREENEKREREKEIKNQETCTHCRCCMQIVRVCVCVCCVFLYQLMHVRLVWYSYHNKVL